MPDDRDEFITRTRHRKVLAETRAALRARHKTAIRKLQERVRESRARGEIRGRREADAHHILRTAARLLGENDTVLDCGANRGDFTALFTDCPATVLGFEPNPDCARHYRDRFADYPRIWLEEAAVGPEAGQATLRYHPDYTGQIGGEQDYSAGSSIHAALAGKLTGQEHRVQVISLADRIAAIKAEGRRVAIVKLDVEGTEIDLMEQFLERDIFSDISICLIETHEAQMPEQADRFADLRRRIASRYMPAQVYLEWY